MTIVVVLVLVSVATFIQAVLAGVALPFFGERGGSSIAFVAFDLLSRFLFVALAAWSGTGLARGAAPRVGLASASILGIVGVVLMFGSREPSTWYNYLGLLVLVGGTLLGSMVWSRTGAGSARAAT